jgi:hypothetical protein
MMMVPAEKGKGPEGMIVEDARLPKKALHK